MVLGGVGWDKKEFPKSNLYVYGKDDTKIVVYSIRRWPKGRDQRKSRNFCSNTVNSCNIVHQQDIII